MSKMEEIVGKVIATLLVLLIIWSTGTTVLRLMFGDVSGLGLYGNRGDSYIYDDYQ